ncbi:hypothetical protein D3C81_31800 [compost metagenome]
MKQQQETPLNTDAVKGWTVTPEGWLQIDIPVRRAGVLVYDEAQGDSFSAKEYVSQDELFAPDSMKTLIGKPVTVSRHPKGGKVNARNYRTVNAGTITDAFRDGDDLIARAVVQDEAAIMQLKTNKRLRGASAGYVCGDKPRQTGNFDGQEYDTVQKGIVYNHVSIVGNPRNKHAVFNLDGKEDMPTVEELQEQVDELTTNCDALTADKEKLTKKIGQLNGELADARKQVLNLDAKGNDAYDRGLKDGEQRHAITEHAKALKINVDSLDPKMMKLAIIKKANEKLNCDSLSDEQIDTALEMAMATKPAPTFTQTRTPQTNNDSQGDADDFSDYQQRIFNADKGKK